MLGGLFFFYSDDVAVMFVNPVRFRFDKYNMSTIFTTMLCVSTLSVVLQAIYKHVTDIVGIDSYMGCGGLKKKGFLEEGGYVLVVIP